MTLQTSLQQNDVFKHQKSTYRLLKVDGQRAYVICMDAKNPVPQEWEASELREFGEIEKIEDTSLRQLSESAADIATGKLRWERIKAIVDHPEIYDGSQRWALLVEHGKSIGVTPKTLLANLRMYWLGGQVEDALRGSFQNCGTLAAEKPGVHSVVKKGLRGKSIALFAPVTTVARGRPPTDYQTFALSMTDRNRLISIAKKTYAKDEKFSIRALSDTIIKTHYSVRDENGKHRLDADGDVIMYPKGKRPSIQQIRRIVEKALAISTLNASRTTKANHANNHAAATGTVQDDCIGPGDVYEIDATFVDAFIVAMADAFTIIGKPTLYLVVDRDTKLIVGFHISLEDPSFAEAKLAILTIASDWEAVCKRLNVPYKASDWPAQGVMPRRFVGDRGEMISFKSDVITEGMNIAISNPPARRASWKPIVESSFKMTQVALKDNVPGYEPSKQVGARDGRKHKDGACLNFNDFARVFLRSVITHNRAVKKGNVVTPKEAFLGEIPSPILKWNRGAGLGKRYSYEYLQRKLSPVDEGAVFVDGIHFKGCVYDFPEAHKNDWMTRASLKGSFKVMVTYSTELVDTVIVNDPFDKRTTYRAVLASESQMLSGYSFAEVKAYWFAQKKLLKRGEELATAGRIALSIAIDELVQPAVTKIKASRKNRTTSRSYAGPEARADEAFSRNKVAHALHGDDTLPHYGDADESDIETDAGDVTPNVVNIADARATKGWHASAAPTSGEPPSVEKVSSPVSATNPSLLSQTMDL
jgi:putative transposase